MAHLEEKSKSLLSQTDPDDQNALIDKSQRFDSLDQVKIWAYGVGHFINDLVAACWFNFLFYYLKRVVETPASNAALLAGQICDGIATPIVGYISDKYQTRWGILIINPQGKELLGIFSDQSWWQHATSPFIRDFNHLKTEEQSMLTTRYFQVCSMSDGQHCKSVT